MSTTRTITVTALLLTFVFAGTASAATLPPPQDTTTFCQNVPPDNPFTDVGQGSHHDHILCLAYARITQGTTPTTYGPTAVVRRDQMASFVARSIDELNRLETGSKLRDLAKDDDNDTFFGDVDNSNVHKQNINRLFEAGIVKGSDEFNYNPSGPVTRGQMATFINRSEQYLTGSPFTTPNDYFTDDNGNVHEPNINGIASVGIAQGKSADTYGPNEPVTREQMASFLVRWFAVHEAAGDITPLPPNTGPDLVSVSGTDADNNFAFSQGDPIVLTFAGPVTLKSSITITDGNSTSVILTDDPGHPQNETTSSFVLSSDGKTVTITPTQAIIFNGGSGFATQEVSVMGASGIDDASTNESWNPDKEPDAEIRFEFASG